MTNLETTALIDKQMMVVLCIGEKGDILGEDAHSPQREGNPEVCQVATLAFV